jgi:hypothetical protein
MVHDFPFPIAHFPLAIGYGRTLMHVYYQQAPVAGTTDRHSIVHLVWDADIAAFDPAVLSPTVSWDHIDEIKANRHELSSLASVSLPGQGSWKYVEGGSYERPDGTVWVPAINEDSSNLEDKAAADEARLNEIRNLDNTATLTDVRRACNDLAAILERVHRVVLRTLEESK